MICWKACGHISIQHPQLIPQPLVWPPLYEDVGGDSITEQLSSQIGSLIDWGDIPAENHDLFMEHIKVWFLYPGSHTLNLH